MGTYCELYIADCPVFSAKSQVSAIVMTFFRERDKKTFDRKCIERNPIQWSHADWDATETERVVEYTASVADVTDRLRVMGFTLARAKADFEAEKAEYLQYLIDLNEARDLFNDEIEILESSNFSDYLEAFREIVSSGVHPVDFSDRKKNASKLAAYILKDREDYYWGFPCRDIRSFFRAFLEIVPGSALVTQDITDLVDGGYYSESDNVCDLAQGELKGDYSVNSRMILLTEGPTDREVLRTSLDLLYPHLADYYSFMDLAVRAPGGTGSLVHVVKAFAGAGIENRTIALFDNDAAGHSALSLLQQIPLPSNILAMTYPDVAIASEYPTYGPNGESVQDINGSACSIELYFGRDVLTTDGRLVPVQWKAYEDRVKRYQGEIRQKHFLKARFLQKAASAKSNDVQAKPEEWEDMRQLLESVFDAFN